MTLSIGQTILKAAFIANSAATVQKATQSALTKNAKTLKSGYELKRNQAEARFCPLTFSHWLGGIEHFHEYDTLHFGRTVFLSRCVGYRVSLSAFDFLHPCSFFRTPTQVGVICSAICLGAFAAPPVGFLRYSWLSFFIDPATYTLIFSIPFLFRQLILNRHKKSI